MCLSLCLFKCVVGGGGDGADEYGQKHSNTMQHDGADEYFQADRGDIEGQPQRREGQPLWSELALPAPEHLREGDNHDKGKEVETRRCHSLAVYSGDHGEGGEDGTNTRPCGACGQRVIAHDDVCLKTQSELDEMLMVAADVGNRSLIQALGAHGASVKSSNTIAAGRLEFPLDGVGWTAIHYAAARGHSECVYMLWQLGAETTWPTRTHLWTPLHLAAAFGHVHTAETLLEIGCDVDARAAGATPASIDARAAGVAAGVAAQPIPAVSGGGEGSFAGGWGGATPLHIAAALGQQVLT